MVWYNWQFNIPILQRGGRRTTLDSWYISNDLLAVDGGYTSLEGKKEKGKNGIVSQLLIQFHPSLSLIHKIAITSYFSSFDVDHSYLLFSSFFNFRFLPSSFYLSLPLFIFSFFLNLPFYVFLSFLAHFTVSHKVDDNWANKQKRNEGRKSKYIMKGNISVWLPVTPELSQWTIF